MLIQTFYSVEQNCQSNSSLKNILVFPHSNRSSYKEMTKLYRHSTEKPFLFSVQSAERTGRSAHRLMARFLYQDPQ